MQGGAASLWSRAIPASHCDGAACVCEGDERWPLQPPDLPDVQGEHISCHSNMPLPPLAIVMDVLKVLIAGLLLIVALVRLWL